MGPGRAAVDDTTVHPTFALVALNIVVAVLGVVGVIVAVTSFTAEAHDVTDGHHDPLTATGIGSAIDTSFGSIFVEQVETLDGLSAEQLGGMTHGIADYVAQTDAKVSIAVLLANRSKHAVEVSPGDYAVFVEGTAEPIPPSSSTIQTLTLQPGSSVDVTVTFVVPRTGAELSMAYADVDGELIVVPVGSVDQVPQDIPTDGHGTVTDDGHDHEH